MPLKNAAGMLKLVVKISHKRPFLDDQQSSCIDR